MPIVVLPQGIASIEQIALFLGLPPLATTPPPVGSARPRPQHVSEVGDRDAQSSEEELPLLQLHRLPPRAPQVHAAAVRASVW